VKILLLSDIHANYPALKAVLTFFSKTSFDAILNCGDSLVYAPFPNETIQLLQQNNVYSILGNTDRKIKKLLRGKSFKKPQKQGKRIMYTWTVEVLNSSAQKYILGLKKSFRISFKDHWLSIFHGSPEDPDEFLFPATSPERFLQLARYCTDQIIITGHSHTPFHNQIKNTHFINPGSVGRMFDANPDASCAVLTIKKNSISTRFYRIP